MYIYNIQCNYTEYRQVDNKWSLTNSSKTTVDSSFINNMLDAGIYFTSMGGTQDIEWNKNRRFGMQVRKITCISFCGSVMKELVFSYDCAKSSQ